AGGFGVLGAVGFTPEQLETELTWIDEHIGDLPYGVDIVIPGKYEGMGEGDAEKLEQELKDLIPEQHRKFADDLLDSHGVPEIPEEERMQELLGWTEATAGPQVQVALAHPKVKLLANALGTPPPDVIEEIHRSGRLVAALCGAPSQAVRHANAGVDIVIAQGTEGGGHTGDVASLVLWPEVIDALGDTPMVAAGGIGSGRQMAAALAMGAQGVWTGSLWLTVEEADVPPAQMQTLLEAGSRDTVRSRSWTGKPCRMLRSSWTAAWERGDLQPLPMPFQSMISDPVMNAAVQGERADVYPGIAGQGIGMIKAVRPASEIFMDFVAGAEDALGRVGHW
ncbi:MAG: nitronate monooxygenase, partial [Pseudomonadales bacterium]|nr:nitronate monooxygenase [Pseudomonadales bacterium]